MFLAKSNALKSGLKMIKSAVTDENSEHYQKTIALPYGIGCGLAGGSWDVVYKIIDETFDDYNVTLYKL